VETIAQKLGIGHSAVQEMIESLGYRKVCACWVLRLLTEDHKGQRKAITSELLQRYRHKGDDFLLCIVTGDESWFQKAVRQSLRMAGMEFYRRGIFKLPERWEKCVQRRLRWFIWFVNNKACYFTKKLLLMTFSTTLVFPSKYT
jgi:hypothetical protein